MQATKRGLFIVFEGLDHSGKTTQSNLLYQYIKAKTIPVRHIAFPNRTTPIGSIINSYLKSSQQLSDQSIHLLFSANRWELAESIENDVTNGITVICDRYAYSGVAYSNAKGLDLEWCRAPDRSLPRPDLVFFLSIPVEIISKRASFGEEKYEKIEFQKKVSEAFAHIVENYWVTLDGNDKVDTISSKIAVEYENESKKAAKSLSKLFK